MVIDRTLVLVIGLLVIVFFLSFARRKMLPEENFISFVQSKKTTLYWFVDAESNARNWFDFGARRSIDVNRGYLSVAFDALVRTQGKDFAIVPLIGRKETLSILKNPNHDAVMLPADLWRAYVISHICAERGGLVMDGNSILTVGPSLASFINKESIEAAMFGSDHDEPVVSAATGVAPGPDQYMGYAAEAHHPSWEYVANQYDSLVSRGNQAWGSASARRMNRTLWETQKTMGAVVLRSADGSRFDTGKLRQLEDYFGRSSDTNTTNLMPNVAYVAYDGDMLARRYEFNWFTQLSPEQIASSDLVWAHLAGL